MDETIRLRDSIRSLVHVHHGVVQRRPSRMANSLHRTVVQFRKMPEEKCLPNKDDTFILELGYRDPYTAVVDRVAKKLHVDHKRIMIARHSCYENKPNLVSRKFMGCLFYLLVSTSSNGICNVLYYKVLPLKTDEVAKQGKDDHFLVLEPSVTSDEIVQSGAFGRTLFSDIMAGEGPSKKICIRSLQISPPMLDDRLKTINELLFPYFTRLAHSSDSTGWLPAAVWFCGLLSGKDPPTERILQNGLVPALILFLTKNDIPELQFEAHKALTYLGSGNSRLTAPNQPTLMKLLLSKDESVLGHACCSLAVLSGCDNVKITNFIRRSNIHYYLPILNGHPTLGFAALCTLGNIMEGNTRIIDWCVDIGIFKKLKTWLADDCVEVRREACWIISYITAEREWIQHVCDFGLIDVLAKLVLKDEFVVMEAAVHAISNAACGATVEQISFMVSRWCIETLCFLFCCRNSDIFKACLDGLEHILEAGWGDGYVNPYALRISRMNGWRLLDRAVDIYGRELFKKGLDLLFEYGDMPVYTWVQRLTFRKDGYDE